jgi:hypothetical protein
MGAVDEQLPKAMLECIQVQNTANMKLAGNVLKGVWYLWSMLYLWEQLSVCTEEIILLTSNL